MESWQTHIPKAGTDIGLECCGKHGFIQVGRYYDV